MDVRRFALFSTVLLGGCLGPVGGGGDEGTDTGGGQDGSSGEAGGEGGSAGDGTSGAGTTGRTAGGSDGDGSGGSGNGDGNTSESTTGTAQACAASPMLERFDGCENRAPADAFSPSREWAYDEGGDLRTSIMPLVANLTEDNGDGSIDLCDTPDVLVVAEDRNDPRTYHAYILDGATGQLHRRIDTDISNVTPAIADLDGDGVPEIITSTCTTQGPTCSGDLLALHADGSVVWRGDPIEAKIYGCAIAVANLDGAGSPEIVCDRQVFDASGNLLAEVGGTGLSQQVSAPVLADLDVDGEMEIVYPHGVASRTGDILWEVEQQVGLYAYALVANLVGDGAAEVLITTDNGVSLYEADGTPVYVEQRSNGVAVEGLAWTRPAGVADLDGDGRAEFFLGSGDQLSAFAGSDGSLKWTRTVVDLSGVSGVGAFDFLGDGTPEVVYADEGHLRVVTSVGDIVVEVPRTSKTLIEYPVVADVDNDGSAEIVVTSGDPGRGFPELTSDDAAPVVQVFGDADDRWVQARRIFNQHTYHVTNILEDGTVPRHEPPHWHGLNTFRANAVIEGDTPCRPGGA